MAEIRVTRQASQILLTETPDMFVTQQYLMVLEGPESASEQTINQALSLNQSLDYTYTYSKNVTQNLTLNQTVDYSFDTQEASNTLNLTATAVGARDIPASASSTLSLTSVGGRTFTFDIESVIPIDHILDYINLIDDREPVGNTLNLVQTTLVSSNPTAESTLNLTQTVEAQYPIKPHVSNYLSLSHHTSTPHRAFVTQDLGVSQFLNTPLPTQHITQNLNLTHESPIGRVEQTLNLTQTAEYSFSVTASNNLSISDELSRTMIYIREVEDSNVVGHALSYYEDSPCGRKRYSPFQGENTIASDFSAPNNTLQDPQGNTGNFSLYTPYLGVPTNEITLRKPELDNRDRNSYSRANNETRGGKLIIYSDPIWPNVRTIVMTIIGLTESEVNEFQDFMEDTLGQEIGLTDWEGRLWKGIITNPNEPAVQDGKENWVITFEFEGEMLSVEQPGSEDGDGMSLNLTHSVTAVIV